MRSTGYSARTRGRHGLGDWIPRPAVGKIFEEGQRGTSLILHAGPDDPLPTLGVESDRLGITARKLHERWTHDSSALGT